MLDYAALNALAAVVREGSFERAARALNVTPSAVSQRVKLLEERTGGALLVRGQPCVATEAGQQLCRHFERVGMLEHELRDALPALGMGGRSGNERERVTVRVAVNADSLATWFMAAAAAFAKQEESALLDLTAALSRSTRHVPSSSPRASRWWHIRTTCATSRCSAAK